MHRPDARWIAAFMMVAATGVAHADAIPGLFNTGVDPAGVVLPGGAVDPHYRLVASADPAYPGPLAIVAAIIPTGYWAVNNGLSKWIAPTADENYPSLGTPHPAGVYTYRLEFDLAGFDPATAQLSGVWGVDNSGVIKLNGVTVVGTSTNYNPLTGFSISTGFIAGVNALDFVITNFASGGANPTAVRVQGLAGTANSLVGVPGDPAAGSLALAPPTPNPARGIASLAGALPHAGRARLLVRDIAGRAVRTLLDRELAAGPFVARWDGADAVGAPVVAGVYVVTLEFGASSVSRRMVRLR